MTFSIREDPPRIRETLGTRSGVRAGWLWAGLVLLLAAGPPRSSAQEAGGPSAEEVAQPDRLAVFAQYVFREGAHVFQVQGSAFYPDETSISLQVFLRNRAADLRNVVAVRGGEFRGQLHTKQMLFPGYYEVRAQFLPFLQVGQGAERASAEPRCSASFPLRIGDDETIARTRREHLDYYETQIRKIQDVWVRVRDIYTRLIAKKMGSSDAARKEWSETCQPHLVELEREFTAHMAQYRNAVLPLFPRMHENFEAGYRTLYNVYGELSLSLVTEFLDQAAASGKTVTREDILAKCDRIMKDFSEAVAAQIALEREEELRDLLLNQVRRIAFLLDISGRLYDMAAQAPNPAAQDRWKTFREDWDAQLASLEEALQAHKTGVLKEKNADAVKNLLDLPGMLRDLWAIRDQVVLEVAGGLQREEERARHLCRKTLSDLLDAFDFREDLELSATQMAMAMKADPDIERRQVTQWMQRLKEEDPDQQLKAIRTLGNYESARKELREGAKAEIGPYADACALALALAGEADMLDRVLPLLERYEDPRYRCVVAEALGVLGDGDKAVPPLSKALLQDADEQVRSSAAIALGQLGQVQATACLLDALEDGSESVRKNAFEAVQNLLPEESLTFYPGAKEEIRKYLTGKLREWWAQRSSPK